MRSRVTTPRSRRVTTGRPRSICRCARSVAARRRPVTARRQDPLQSGRSPSAPTSVVDRAHVLEHERRAVPELGVVVRRATPSTTGDIRGPDDHERLAGRLAHPPRPVREQRGDEARCTDAGDRSRRAARLCPDARLGVVEKRIERPPQRLRRAARLAGSRARPPGRWATGRRHAVRRVGVRVADTRGEQPDA